MKFYIVALFLLLACKKDTVSVAEPTARNTPGCHLLTETIGPWIIDKWHGSGGSAAICYDHSQNDFDIRIQISDGHDGLGGVGANRIERISQEGQWILIQVWRTSGLPDGIADPLNRSQIFRIRKISENSIEFRAYENKTKPFCFYRYNKVPMVFWKSSERGEICDNDTH